MLTILLFLAGYAAVVFLLVKVISSGSAEDNMEEQALKFWDNPLLKDDLFLN